MIGMLLGDLLAEMGFEVCAIAASHSAAVLAAEQHKPDLMIVDIDLGKSSGISAVAEILGSGFVPHLFMSGNPSWFRDLAPGTVTLLKPFDEAALADAIGRVFAAGVPAADGDGAVAAKEHSPKAKT